MSTARFIVALITGIALVFAVPGATAESPPAAPDGTEPVAPGTTAPAAAPTPEPIPQPATAPTPEALQEPSSGPASEAAPQSASGPTPEPSSEPGSDPKPEPSPEPGTGPKPEPSPEPGTDPTPEPPSPPTGPPPTDGSGGDPCFLTSAGLACTGNPPCVVTSSGVTCGTNCTVTSAGLTCPPRGGDVPPRGQVLSGEPVSGGPKPTPTRPVKSEGEVKPTIATGGKEGGADQLPFTGAPVLLWLVVGCGLLASGLLLRRTTSTAGPAVEPAGEATPLAVLPGPSPRTWRLPSRRAIVLPSLALVACGVLLRRGMRR